MEGHSNKFTSISRSTSAGSVPPKAVMNEYAANSFIEAGAVPIVIGSANTLPCGSGAITGCQGMDVMMKTRFKLFQ